VLPSPLHRGGHCWRSNRCTQPEHLAAAASAGSGNSYVSIEDIIGKFEG
jgi:hypothetical protein